MLLLAEIYPDEQIVGGERRMRVATMQKKKKSSTDCTCL